MTTDRHRGDHDFVQFHRLDREEQALVPTGAFAGRDR